MKSGGGIEKDANGVAFVPLTTVASGTTGDAASENFYSCPLALGRPVTDPSLASLLSIYRAVNSMEGRLGPLVLDSEDMSVQVISLLQILDREIKELEMVEMKRRT